MKHLELTPKQLKKVGFKKRICPEVDEFNPEKVVYEIECLNGIFYYSDNANYRWYHKTIIGEVSNHTNLNIVHASGLYAILSAFNVEYNLVIF